MLQLLQEAEIRDVFATAGVQFEQLKRMGRFGGVALQLQGMMQKGFRKVSCCYPTRQSFMHLTVNCQTCCCIAAFCHT